MDNLIYSLRSVLPLFVMIFLGYFLRRWKIINEDFVSIGTKIVFNVSLPVLLFRQIAASDLTVVFNPGLILYGLGATVILVALMCLIVPLFIKDKPSQGAFIQGVYRGNFAILGVPLAINMFGQEGALPAALMLPFAVPLYNAMAVVILTLYSAKAGQKINFKKILLGIVTNPLIIGIVLGLPFSFFGIRLPELADRCLEPVSSLCTPLALLCLGGQFTFRQLKENFKISLIATILKLVLIPALVLAIAVLIGFRGGELGALFIMFMAPSAVSSYIMAKTMHSNDELAAQILILTTFFSSITIFLGILLLKSLGLI